MRLRQEGSVIEFDKMSLDEFLIHLFARDSDSQMSKMALELLEKDKPRFQTLINKCKEIEASVWYHERKEFSRMASTRPPRFCKPCDSKTHNESECWGECQNCHQRGHQTKYCRNRRIQPQQGNIQSERADKAAPKGKKKRNRKSGKKAIVASDSRRRSKEEESYSEEESLIKRDEPEELQG